MILVKRFAGFSLIALALFGTGALVGSKRITIQEPNRFVIISEARAFDTKTGNTCTIPIFGQDVSGIPTNHSKIDYDAIAEQARTSGLGEAKTRQDKNDPWAKYEIPNPSTKPEVNGNEEPKCQISMSGEKAESKTHP